MRNTCPILFLIAWCFIPALSASAQKSKTLKTKESTRLTQFEEKPKLRWGASMGMGGLHMVAKPSVDLHYAAFTLRLSPGLYFLSAGINWLSPLQWKRKDCNHWPIYLGAYYHYSHLLAQKVIIKDPEVQLRQMFMLMAGIHAKLNYRGQVYVDVGVGVSLVQDKLLQPDLSTSTRTTYMPMAEVRLGGIFDHLPHFFGKRK
jgi:hypothetical protein